MKLELFLAPKMIREAIADCFEQDARSMWRQFSLWPMQSLYCGNIEDAYVILSPRSK